MSLPVSYTEATLASYMHAELGAVATALGYAAPGVGTTGVYGEAVNDTATDYRTSDISLVTGRDNLRLLRALARVNAWRKVVKDTTGDFDFETAGQKFSRSQTNTQARSQLTLALEEARTAGWDDMPLSYAVGIDHLTFVQDPYNSALTDTDHRL